MRIKINADGNKYLLTDDNMWVRDFTNEGAPFVDINKNIRKDDYFTFLKNEFNNGMLKLAWIDSEDLHMKNVLIVSDGYKFHEKHQIVSRLPKDVVVIGVNGSLSKWEIPNRSMNWYLNNNPYDEGLYYLPRKNRVLPKCLVSTRTNSRFVSAYKGSRYKYFPVNESTYSSVGANNVSWQVDDYRNPICAAIAIAYRAGAEKICLLCCDNSFDGYREGSEKLENGLYQYPQQNIAHNIIDGVFYWLRNHDYFDFDIADCSCGKEYKFATYIKEEDILPFFNKAGEK